MDEAAVAGASSLAEYERRHAQHCERVRRRRLVIAIIAIGVVAGIAFTETPHVVGWVVLLGAARS